MVSINAHFLMAVSIRRKQQSLWDLNWNRLAAWALLCHQLTPLCVPMYSNWLQPRKNAEAVLFRQAYCTSVCGPRLVYVRLFVGLSWPTSQCRTVPKVGRVVIDEEPERRNYELCLDCHCCWSWFQNEQNFNECLEPNGKPNIGKIRFHNCR